MNLKEIYFKILEKKERSIPWLIGLIFLALFVMCFSKLGNPIIDCGREVLVPYRILKGEVLFRDIFCTYGAFAYYFNAFCFFAFGVSIYVLYIVGGFLGLGVVYGVYYLSCEFLNKTLSFVLTLFVMCACAFSVGIFNFVFPYSFSMLWATFAFVWSLVFLIRYLKVPSGGKAALVMLFFGLSLSNKYDYLPYVLPVLLSFFYFKPIKKITPLFWVFFFPLLTLLMAFINGATIGDVLTNAHFLLKMMATPSLKYFYTYSAGTYFEWKVFINVLVIAFKNIFVFMLFAYLTLFVKKIRYKFLRILAFLGIASLLAVYAVLTQPDIYKQFVFFPMLLALIVLYNFIRSYDNKIEAPYLILILSALMASLKTFFCLLLSVYGTYAMTVLVVALAVSLNRYFLKRMHSKKYTTLAISMLFGVYAITNFAFCYLQCRYALKGEISSQVNVQYGKITYTSDIAEDVNELIDFLEQYTSPEDGVVVLPEGQMVNFFAKRPALVYYDSLTPLYFETFGEYSVIKEFQDKKPKYVIISDRDTSEYGAKWLCRDYGLDFCAHIAKNYDREAILGSKMKFFVFKLKE